MKLENITLVIIIILLVIALILTIQCTMNIIGLRQYVSDIQDSSCETIHLLEDKTEFFDAELVHIQQLSDELSRMRLENDELKRIILDDELNTKTTIDQDIQLPIGIPTNMFRCEDFRNLNVKNSDQYKLQQECVTDLNTGIRFIYEDKEPYYCVALAGAFGSTIGDAWNVVLANGENFNIILADFKHPIDNLKTDDYGDIDKNYDGNDCINVIEFVCDLKISPKSVIQAGTMSALEQFGGLYGEGGNIIEMKYLGRKWVP